MKTQRNIVNYYRQKTVKQLEAHRAQLKSQYNRLLNNAFNEHDCCRIRSEIEIIDAELERRGAK